METDDNGNHETQVVFRAYDTCHHQAAVDIGIDDSCYNQGPVISADDNCHIQAAEAAAAAAATTAAAVVIGADGSSHWRRCKGDKEKNMVKTKGSGKR